MSKDDFFDDLDSIYQCIEEWEAGGLTQLLAELGRKSLEEIKRLQDEIKENEEKIYLLEYDAAYSYD